jgi:hypothetical protein
MYDHKQQEDAMEYTIQLDKENEWVFIRATGEWDRGTDDLMVQEIMHIINENGLRKVLLDIRELQFDLSMVQIFERVKTLREARMKQETTSSRVALVYDAQNPKLVADMKFFETASQNRMVPYRVFIHIEEARKWLLHA